MIRMMPIFFALTLPLLPGPAGAADPQRHSGTVVAIEGTRGILTLEEMGPWVPDREAPVTNRQMHLTPDLAVKLIERAPDGVGDDGWRGGFVETRIAVSALRTGDYVTVEARRRGGEVVVESIEVIRPATGG